MKECMILSVINYKMKTRRKTRRISSPVLSCRVRVHIPRNLFLSFLPSVSISIAIFPSLFHNFDRPDITVPVDWA